jgi:hypothetical protein
MLLPIKTELVCESLFKSMATNKELLSKGIKYLAGALPLLFIGPSLIYNAFMNQQNVWHYLVLAIGITACIAGMFLIFLGLKTIMKSLFSD